MITAAVKEPRGKLSPTGDPLAYISPSRLKSFLTCRLRFFFEKILGLKSPVSPALQVGKAVHAGLQFYHKALWRGGDHSPEVVVQQYHVDYAALEAEGRVNYKDDRDKRIADGERVLRAYLDSEIAKKISPIVGVEVSLKSSSLDLPIPLLGIVDLVRGDNRPVDFKTVAATPNPEAEAWQHQLQMTAYHMLLHDATGEAPSSCQLIFLVKTKTPKVVSWTGTITQEQIDRFRTLVDVYVQGVTRSEYYPSVGMACSWCFFKRECAAWVGRSQSIAA